MTNKKETKADAKATAGEEAAEQTFLAKQTKQKAEQETPTQQQGEDLLPPPDPPVVPSLPQEPATGYEVDHQVKHADPEVEMVVRELDLVIEGVRGEGPSPEEPEAPPPPEGKAKKGEEE